MKGIPTNEFFKKNDESTEVADVNPNGEKHFSPFFIYKYRKIMYNKLVVILNASII